MTKYTFFFLALLVAVEAGNCPQNSAEYGDQGECVYPIDAMALYPTAKLLCEQLNGQIIPIRSVFENLLAASQAQTAIVGNSQSYIGVIKGSNGTWTYADGRPLTYSNWASGHPLSNKTCAVLSSQTYSWTSVNCSEPHTFVCTIPNQKCPDGWVYFREMCYYFYNPKVTNTSTAFTVGAAENACKKIGAHLVSIHSDDEFNFLKDQIKTNLPNNKCRPEQALIGLTCGDKYAWFDESAFDYDKTKGKCAPVYTINNDPHCLTNDSWDYWDSQDLTFYRYICEKKLTDGVE